MNKYIQISNYIKNKLHIIILKHIPFLNNTNKQLQKNKQPTTVIFKTDCILLRLCNQKLKNYKNVVMAAVQHMGYSLQYASKNLKNDKDI